MRAVQTRRPIQGIVISYEGIRRLVGCPADAKVVGAG
jgi:alkylated DNA nucleotide flippase Atl1